MDRVRITQDTEGSPRGIHTREFSAGEVVGMDDPRMSRQLAEVLVDDGTAEWVPEGRETKPVGPTDTKPDGPAETKERWYEGNGSWKELWEADSEDSAGWLVDKVQCSKEEAEAWTEGEVSADEIA